MIEAGVLQKSQYKATKGHAILLTIDSHETVMKLFPKAHSNTHKKYDAGPVLPR